MPSARAAETLGYPLAYVLILERALPESLRQRVEHVARLQQKNRRDLGEM